MTDRVRRFCQVMSMLAVAAMATDTSTVMRLELARWHCTGVDSCSVRIPSIAISHAYALTDWRSVHSGGETLWRKSGGTWHRVASGGGTMNAADLRRYGVPENVAAELLQTRNIGRR